MEDLCDRHCDRKGASARSIRLDLPKFTLVGATTRAGLLTAPLRSFRSGTSPGILYRKELHDDHHAVGGCTECGDRSAGSPPGLPNVPGGTPRLANRLLKRVRDFCTGALRWKDHRRSGILPPWIFWRWIPVDLIDGPPDPLYDDREIYGPSGRAGYLAAAIR